MKTIFSIYENLSMGGVPAVMRQRARWTEHAATNVFYYQNDRGGLNAMRGIGNLHVYVGIQNHQTNIEQIAARYRPDKIFLYSHYHLGSLLRAYCSEIYFEYHRSDTTSVQSLLKYARSATQIHVPTLWSKRFIEQNSRDPISTKIEIVPNVIDRPGLEESWIATRRMPGRHFIWIGQFGDHKNIADALRIFAGIASAEDPTAQLHVVLSRDWNKDSVRDALNQALTMGIFDRLHLYNDLEPAQIAKLMKMAAASDGLNIVTSKRESYGLSIAESRAFGLVSLATDVGAIGEHVRDGESGLLFPFGDIPTALRKASEFLKNPELRQRLKQGMQLQLEADKKVVEQSRAILA